jgi:hypothetical protein
MNIGTRCSDEVFTEGGVLVIAGLGTLAVGVRVALLVVGVADGPDRAGPVIVADEGTGLAELMEAAPAQPAKTVASAVAPARDRAADRRGCLIWTNSHECDTNVL